MRAARGLVLLATASYGGPGGVQPPLAASTSTGQTLRRLPILRPGAGRPDLVHDLVRDTIPGPMRIPKRTPKTDLSAPLQSADVAPQILQKIIRTNPHFSSKQSEALH
ncbi:putative uncharacterized protein [Burkholderiales bacterium GJ-E10]|nr:putative uncharacterized protein [Burkholderiales bacterium GJ-E10]